MLRVMCKSKLHRVSVTDTNVDYTGSVIIDSDLMARADIATYEKVLIVNIENGQRFETYAIPGDAGSGIISLLGGAARLAGVGDKLIIMTFSIVEEEEVKSHNRKLVQVDENNKPL